MRVEEGKVRVNEDSGRRSEVNEDRGRRSEG